MKPTDHGYVYWVEETQLRAFAALTHAQRFEWVEETRAFLVMAATPETIERIQRLRRGETICADAATPSPSPPAPYG